MLNYSGDCGKFFETVTANGRAVIHLLSSRLITDTWLRILEGTEKSGKNEVRTHHKHETVRKSLGYMYF
jgi:hypothetical protein